MKFAMIYELLESRNIPIVILFLFSIIMFTILMYWIIFTIVGKKSLVPKCCKICMFLRQDTGFISKCDSFILPLVPWHKKKTPCPTEGIIKLRQQEYMEFIMQETAKRENRDTMQSEIANEKLAGLADEIGVDSLVLASIKDRLVKPCMNYFMDVYDIQLDRFQIEMEIERQILMCLKDDTELFSKFALSHAKKMDESLLDCINRIENLNQNNSKSS